MAKLATLILGVSSKVAKDKAIRSVLLSIASGAYTAEEMRQLRRLVVSIFYTSEYTGYDWQTGIVGKRVTRDGVEALVKSAKSKGVLVADRIEQALIDNPQAATAIQQTSLAGSAVYEGTSNGQRVSADELGLGFKTWVHTGGGAENRPHHVDIGGTTIPRNEKFRLSSGSVMEGPHDWSIPNAAKENINCYCVVLFSPYATTGELRKSVR